MNAAPPLRLLFWESTWRCNLACTHCRRLQTGRAGEADLTTDEARLLFDSAARLGRPIIVFSGGEPLMRNDWQALSDYAHELHLPTALATNGTMIDQQTAGRIGAAGFRRVSVSLDGADEQTHDSFRAARGAFRLAVAGIGALRNSGQAVQVNCTIASHNVRQLDAVYSLSLRLGAEALHLFLLVPVGCGAEIAATHRLDPQQCEDVLRWVCDHQEGGGIELKATCAPQYYRLAAERGMAVEGSRGCLAGISVAFVGHAGQVFPCGYLPVSCGSVRDNDFASIWHNSAVFAALRDFSKLQGKCGQCEFRTVCGGCRARAYAQTGNYMAAEPACAHLPGAAKKRKRAGRG